MLNFKFKLVLGYELIVTQVLSDFQNWKPPCLVKIRFLMKNLRKMDPRPTTSLRVKLRYTALSSRVPYIRRGRKENGRVVNKSQGIYIEWRISMNIHLYSVYLHKLWSMLHEHACWLHQLNQELTYLFFYRVWQILGTHVSLILLCRYYSLLYFLDGVHKANLICSTLTWNLCISCSC